MNDLFVEALNAREHPIKNAKKKIQTEYITALTYIIEKTISETNCYQTDTKQFVSERLLLYQSQLFANLWNDDYMDKVMVKVLSNFSHERIDHLKEVVRYLRPVAKVVASKKEQTSHQTYSTTRKDSYEEEKRRCQERGDYLGAKIGAGAVVGAAVGGVIASVAGAPVAGVIGGVVAGAVVGGATTTLIVNGGKR